MKIPSYPTRLLLICLFPVSGLAQETVNTYEPVNFPADQSSIVSRIEFPDDSKDVLVRVFCDVAVTKAGDFEESICWSDYEDGVRFTKAVEKNIDGIQLNPAQVNGDTVDIWFQYTVQFERRDGNEYITLFPHQFVGVAGSGDGFTSPQLYNTSVQTPGLRLECSGSYFIWYGIIVPAEGGTPTKVQALNKSGRANCRRHSQAVAEKGLYIPAFLNGIPVEAAYKQIWSDQAWR